MCEREARVEREGRPAAGRRGKRDGKKRKSAHSFFFRLLHFLFSLSLSLSVIHLGVQVLDLAVGEDPVELAGRLELGAQLVEQGEALNGERREDGVSAWAKERESGSSFSIHLHPLFSYLLLARQLQQVLALPHDGGTAGRHLEDGLLLGLPGQDVELLLL